MTTWYTQPIFGSYLTVAGVAIALVALLLIGPVYRKLSWNRRGILLGLRVGIILLLLLALLRPARVSTTTKPQTGVMMVLVDRSRSMGMPSGGSNSSRWDAQRNSLDAASGALAEVAEQFDVKVYTYDSKLAPLDFANSTFAWPAKPEGPETDIGTNLADATRRELGRRILGVVLLGDGVQTSLEPRVETQEAARELARLGAPLYTVVFGPIGDSSQARDVAIDYLQDQYTVFVKNEVVIKGLMRVTGFTNQEIPVELIIEDASGNQEKLGPQRVLVKGEGQQVEVSFPYTPTKAGQYKLILRALPQPGELVTKNNELHSFLNVLDGGLRVLYLEGDLRPEQKFLRRSLNDSPDIDVDFQWIDHRNRDKWPVDLGDLFVNPKFDVLIIGDLDSAALGEQNLKAIEKAIANKGNSPQGRGFAMLGGFHSFGAGGYQSTPLANLLPVTMDRFLRQDFGKPIAPQLHVPGPLPMQPAADHPLVRLAAPADNAAVWSKLPPLRGANRFDDVKESAQTVLKSGQTPLLVRGQYGDGRVLAFAGDSTWQWWMRGHEAEHRRFWRQLILWLAQRQEDSKSDVWVRLRQRRFNPGAKVAFEVGAKSPTGDEIAGATFTATITKPDGQTTTARLTKEAGQQWNGLFSETTQPGDYRLTIEAKANGQAIGTPAQTQFLVFDQDLELASQSADADLMARLANLTKDAGGRAVPPEQLTALFREIKAQPREAEIEVQTKWQLGDTSLDAWSFFLLFLGLLTGEWFLRKKWGLV